MLGKRSRDDGPSSTEKKRKKIHFPRDRDDMNWRGLIIGPGGATQKSLEQQSGARILVRGKGASKEGEEGADEEMHVLIVGDDDGQVDAAEALVHELLYNPTKASQMKQQQLKEVAAQQSGQAVSESPYSSSTSLSSPTSSLQGSSHGEHRMEIRIPTERVGIVIGKGGDTIRQLQQMTGCTIQVAKESPAGESDRIITLIGTDEQIVRADEEIRRVCMSGGLRSSSFPSTPSASSSSHHAGLGYGQGGGSSFTLHVPNIAVGLLIGKSGETIRSLQQRTGAVIQVQKNSEADLHSQTREVVLIGNDEQIEAARREVDFIVQEKTMEVQRDTQPDRGGGGGGGGPGGGMGGEPPARVVMRVPNSAVGTIIGRAGETIKRLQQMTGARIQIDRNENKPEREITISGGAEEVERARVEVDDLVRQKASGASHIPPPSAPLGSYARGPPPSYPPYGAPPYYNPYDPYAAPPGYPPYGYPPPGPEYGGGYGHYPYGQQPQGQGQGQGQAQGEGGQEGERRGEGRVVRQGERRGKRRQRLQRRLRRAL